MRARAGAVVAVVVVVLAGLVAALPSAARAEDPPGLGFELRGGVDRSSAARGDTVERRVATFTEADRPSSIPPSAVPHYRLRGGGVTVDLDDARVYGDARIAGTPPSDQRPTVFYHVGTLVGRDCQISDSPLFDAMHGVESYENGPLPAAWRTGRCAAVVLREPGEGAIVDVLVGPLVDELPRLALGRPSMLGSKRLALVRGVWTRVSVPVRNAGPGIATSVTVTGKGKGLAVRRGRLGYSLGREQSGTVSVLVKLKGAQQRTKLALTATVGSVRARRSTPVRRIAPPARPKPGAYVTRGALGSFVVRGGKVRGFRISTTTRCGDRTTQNTYSFRTTPVPRNGIVQAQEKGSLYTASLALKIVGARVTHGGFSYSGPAGCYATETFTARRR